MNQKPFQTQRYAILKFHKNKKKVLINKCFLSVFYDFLFCFHSLVEFIFLFF